MHPRITELLSFVERETEALRATYEAMPAEHRGVRTDPARWSAAEVIQHLAIVERAVTRRLAALVEQARDLPPETESTPLLPSASVARALDRSRRFMTSETAQPGPTDPTRVWADFMAARRDLLTVVATGDGLSLGRVSAPHPMLGAFSGYEWIAFAGAHAARHAEQIREMQRTS